MRLKDKIALVTGASQGIGLGIAQKFAVEGATIAANYRPGGNRAAEAEELVKTFATPSAAFGADVSQRGPVEKMVADVVARFGRIDIVVNNAGVEIKKPFPDITDEEWNTVIGVNLYGSFVVTQACVRQMIKQGTGGKVIFISSVHEDAPFLGYAPYCASKGAIRMMMRTLAWELAQYRINCNNIAPGAIATPINQAALVDPAIKAETASQIPLGRWGTPEDVASVAVFLAGAESDYVTGSTYYVDGGLVLEATKH
jgi:glucose 1-dehydrogenase